MSIKNVLSKACGLGGGIYQTKGESIYRLCYGGNIQVRKFFNYLYKDSVVYLERKYNKFNWQVI
jgi:hypothetical protein